MLKNYLKIAVRNFLRSKLYAAVSVLSLVIGLAVSLLALEYILFEFSFDNVPGKDQTYEVLFVNKSGGVINKSSYTPPHLDEEMKNYFPEIKTAASFVIPELDTKVGNSQRKQWTYCLGDSNIFKILGINFLQGNPRACLLDPNSLVVTEKFEKFYFPNGNAIGHVIKVNYNGWRDFTITGIVKNFPPNSSISFSVVIPSENYKVLSKSYKFTWNATAPFCIIKLQKGVDGKKLVSKLPEFIKATGGDTSWSSLELVPMKYVHFRPDVNTQFSTIEPKYLLILSVVALLILAVSIFNFIGISIMLLSKKTKEIGIRKVSGASNSSIMLQFFFENGMLLLIALIGAVCLSELLQPLFNSILGMHLKTEYLNKNSVLLILLAFIIVIDISAGMYSTHFFTSLKVQSLIKGQLEKLNPKQSLRKVLIGLQFTIAAFLICCTLVIIDQLNFIRHKDLGIKSNNILIIDQYSIGNRIDALKTELSRCPYITDISEASNFPSLGITGSVRGKPDNFNKTLNLNSIDVDEHFIPMLGIKLIKGRNFNPEFALDSNWINIKTKMWWAGNKTGFVRQYVGSVILNQAAYDELKAANQISSDSVHFFGSWKLIGVIKNYNYSSLKDQVEPLVLEFQQSGAPYLGIKIQDGRIKDALTYIKSVWKRVNPDYLLQYNFLEDDINKLYQSEDRTFAAILSGSTIAILIALMGVFALSSFISEAKTKEIAIRKVVGSSTTGIIKLLSFSFIKIVLFANIISWPIAYLVMRGWLQNFAYRTNLHLIIFPLTALLMIILASVTTVLQTLRAATANPVKSLRYE